MIRKAMRDRRDACSTSAAQMKGIPRGKLAVLALAACLAVILRVPFFTWPLTSDEGGYAYVAHWWFRGLTLYSADLWLDRPQGIFLAYKLGSLLLGEATWAIRLWGGAWAAAAAVAVYAVASRLFDQAAGIAAAFIFAVFSVAPHIEGFTANAEIFMVVPATLSACFLLARRPLWAGLMASLAVLLKPSGLSAFLLAIIWLLCCRANWRTWLLFGLGALPPALLAVGHGTLTVGWPQYLYSVALFRLATSRQLADAGWPVALERCLATCVVWLPLTLVGIQGLRRGCASSRVFAVLWAGSSVAGMALGGRWFLHYFTQLIPPLAACAGAGVTSLWRSRKLWMRAEGVALLAVFFISFEGPLMAASAQEGAETLYHRRGILVAEDVAAYIQAHTREEETLYVAFAEADIYHLAQRRSAAPYLFYLDVAFLPGAYDRIVEAIEAREPVYVLTLDPPIVTVDPQGRFWQALAEGYTVETSFEGVPLYRRK